MIITHNMDIINIKDTKGAKAMQKIFEKIDELNDRYIEIWKDICGIHTLFQSYQQF